MLSFKMGCFNLDGLHFFAKFLGLPSVKSVWVVPEVKEIAHKVNDRLCFVKCSRRRVYIQHHFPLCRTNANESAIPYLKTTAKVLLLSTWVTEK